MHCNARHFRPQHAAFCSAKCRFSYFGMAFPAIKRDVFIAHSRCLVHNRLIYQMLSLHTFPCGFHGLRYFYFQSPPYFRVMENQKESRQAQIVTRSKQPPPLFGSSEIRSDSPPLLSAGWKPNDRIARGNAPGTVVTLTAPWKGKSVFSVSPESMPCIYQPMHAMPVFNAFALPGRSFTYACIPMALPWAMRSLGFQPVK